MALQELEELLGDNQDTSSESTRHPVVIIDDDASIREGLAFLLSDTYTLTLCAAAQEGVDAVHEDVCAVILDVRMAKRDGFWACNEIRKKVPTVPVIFYSAYQDVKNPYDIINEHRPFGYVRKDENIQKLVEMVAEAVKHQALVVSNRKLIESLKKLQQRPR